MAKLRQLEITVDGTYSNQDSRKIAFSSRPLCNFLERHLATVDFETKSPKVVLIISNKLDSSSGLFYKDPAMIEVKFQYKIQNINELPDKLIQKHLTRALEIGLKSCQKYMEIPYEFCIRIIEKFRDGNFSNQWNQADLQCESLGVQSRVIATLESDAFSLRQLIEVGGETILEKVIARTKPRELLFEHLLGALKIEGGRYLVYRKADLVISRFDLKSYHFDVS